MPHLSPYEIELAILDNLTATPKMHFNNCQRCMMAVCSRAMDIAEASHVLLKAANDKVMQAWQAFDLGRRKRRFWLIVFIVSNTATFLNVFIGKPVPTTILFVTNSLFSGFFGYYFSKFFTTRDKLLHYIEIADRREEEFKDKRKTATSLMAGYAALAGDEEKRSTP